MKIKKIIIGVTIGIIAAILWSVVFINSLNSMAGIGIGSLSSKVCKFFDFLSAVKLDRRFCIIFVDSHIIGRASHRLLHQSSERWIYQNKSRLFR